MADRKTTTLATVVLTVEIPCGDRWGDRWVAEDVYVQCKREALSAVQKLGYKVIGEPRVKTVTTEEEIC